MRKYLIQAEYGIQSGDLLKLEVRALNSENALKRLIREAKKAKIWNRVGLSNCHVKEVE